MFDKLSFYFKRYRYHATHRMLPDNAGGFAACGQDLLVAELLNHKREGVFFDIGANDGVTISNTLYFEKELGWRGVAVEPIPRIFAQLKENRKCHVVHGCVTPQPGKAKFLEMVGERSMLSTLAINNTGLIARRLRNNARRGNTTLTEIDVDCFTFAQLAQSYGITEVDFLSVDTEGGELDILRSIDFRQTPVRVISVENNYYTNSTRRYLEQNGFLYVGTFKIDEIYIYGGDALRDAL